MKAKHINLIAVLLLLFAMILTMFGGVGQTYAAEITYSNVLDDLQKDSNFNVADYPAIDNDYGLQVIQIAINKERREMYVYTYQPCQGSFPLTATSIKMSGTDKMGFEIEDYEELAEVDKPHLYGLTLLNTNGVFCKYKVDGLKVATAERGVAELFNIASIYRLWNKDIDIGPVADNTISEVDIPVGKLFSYICKNGNVEYHCKETKTVKIVTPYVDFVSYYNGLTWGSVLGLTGTSYVDVHYVAFNTDWQIDTLKEADITYIQCPYTVQGGSWSYGEASAPQYKTIDGTSEVSSSNNWSAQKYSWKCIQRSSDFVEMAGLKNTAKDEVEKTEFVLVFLETEYTQKTVTTLAGHQVKQTGTKVSDVSILRLKFEKDGITYNLGAVMDKTTGDDTPGNQDNPVLTGFWEWLADKLGIPVEHLKAIVFGVIALIVLAIALPILSVVFPVVGQILKYVLKFIALFFKYLFLGLWYIITSPLRLISALVRKIRGN